MTEIWKNGTMGIFIIYTQRQVLQHDDQIRKDGLSGTYSKDGRNETCLQSLGRRTWRKKI